MSVEIVRAELVTAQQHGPPGEAFHFVILAGAVAAGIVLYGLSRWRRRREAAPDEQPLERPRPDEEQ
jgi:hypothetical protein